MKLKTATVIECLKLTKTYENGAIALNEFTLSVEQGSSFGLMGENGAGKSTLVRLLLGFIFPTSGQLRLFNQSKVQQAHHLLGYLHERPFVELRFSGRRYLSYLAELASLTGTVKKQRVQAVLEQVDLVVAANERLDTYSKGMLQRLNIAQALLTNPQLLILDEPTSSLDPYSQWKVRQIMAELRRQGKTIFLCSHHVGEVESLCDNVGILQHGKLVRYGAVSSLLKSTNLVEIVLASDEPASLVAKRLGIAAQVSQSVGNSLHIPAESQPVILTALLAAAIPIHSLNPVSPSLEEVYISSIRDS